MSRRLATVLRVAFLLLVGSQSLHSLRYVLAPDGEAGPTLAAHGRGELHLMVSGPAIGAVCAVLVAALVVRALDVPRSSVRRAVRTRWAWPLSVAALLAIYASQEMIECALGHGHEAGIGVLLEDGGWVALPMAVALGGLIALVMRLARAADALTVNPVVTLVVRFVLPLRFVLCAAPVRPAQPPLVLGGAGRGPPIGI